MSTQPDRYLLITTSGGLNQQRTGIIDAVVAAYLLNATLVVPNLDRESFWNDSSNFSDIFDVDWFITYLSKDVKIIKQLPEKAGKVITTHVPRNCDPECYQTRILPIFDRKRVVHLTKFDYRLSNWLDTDLQKLRCRVNYHALRFTHPILAMGRKLVERMRTKSKHFLALHLRKRDPDRERRQGKCPLKDVDVFLSNNNGNMRKYWVKKVSADIPNRFMGEMEIETGGSGSSLFHENPLSCICTNSTENKSTRRRYDDEDDLLFLEDLSGYDDDDDDGIPRRLDGGRN
ncbi:UNVERIFIED_CONTAM: protein ROOT HAIR SPECIFIC 17 [Sesamum calycinum]|uniref:O-fucosyltransferase family protein n=1 Tax=Sesamum calycinum TaxID=2727403 RepID=A0AAW2R7Y1_9LAMI